MNSVFSNMTATIEIPGDKPVNPIWPLLAICVEAISLGSLLFFLKYTVRYRSGLNEPDKLNRIWSRVGQIRSQPVNRPLIFALAVGLGSQTMLGELVSPIFAVLGLSPAHPNILVGVGLVMGLVSPLISAAVGVLVYKAVGGEGWRNVLLGGFGVNIIMMAFLAPTIATTMQQQAQGELSAQAIILIVALSCVIAAALMVLFQLPIAIWAGRREVPPTAELIPSSPSQKPAAKMDKTLLIVSVPLVLFYLLGLVTYLKVGSGSYLARVATSCSSWIHIAVASISAIFGVNRGLFANQYQWQWRAFLTPAIPLFVLELVFVIIAALFSDVPFGFLTVMLFSDFAVNGSYGVLGTYAYLTLAERYAKTNAFLSGDNQPQPEMASRYETSEYDEPTGW